MDVSPRQTLFIAKCTVADKLNYVAMVINPNMYLSIWLHELQSPLDVIFKLLHYTYLYNYIVAIYIDL